MRLPTRFSRLPASLRRTRPTRESTRRRAALPAMLQPVRWLAAGALGIGCLSSPRLAAAREPYFSDGEGTVLLVAFLSDVTFTVVDAVAAANDSRHNAWVIP